MKDDSELLKEFASDRSEEAFSELVTRHCNLVWAAAYRVLADADLARDAAQMVFTDLALKADRLVRHTAPAAWLHRAAYVTASKMRRSRTRQAERAEEAMKNEALSPSEHSDSAWLSEMLPLLDEAMMELNEQDRSVITLRYLAGRSFLEVAAAIGTKDDTAQRRASRAVEKLRASFRRRGIMASGGAVSVALKAAGAQAAPAGLATALSSGALATAAATPFTPSLYSVLKTKIIITMKANIITALVIGAPLAIVLGWQHQSLHQLQLDNASLREQIESRTAAAAPTTPATAASATPEELAQAKAEHAELLRLRGEYGLLMRKSGDMAATVPKRNAEIVQAAVDASEWDRNVVDYMKNIGLLCRLYSNDNHDLMPTNFAQIAEPLKDLRSEVPAELFEFVQYGRPASLNVPGEILMREKVARVFPDGRRKRAYLLVDGSVQDASPDADGTFDAVEKSFGLATMGPITPAPAGQPAEASK